MDRDATILLRIPAQASGARAWNFELRGLKLRAVVGSGRLSLNGSLPLPAHIEWMGKIVAELGGRETAPGVWQLPDMAAREGLERVLSRDRVAARFLIANSSEEN